ncbi:hypothetical protein [Neobacillus ginsengisoli]|uniref:Homing endonuclease LAGLIDADG domain-containing protein n=1 Tax=Neobacillus ginsengisoli TaxID=904295 RepID=A0ABT9XUS5_9BACI|nr:hypothetical protein [Neobacillus ginsengisoli]MDQ0199310.1 hypothetical protein [Neobacillus ginsengisoli]
MSKPSNLGKSHTYVYLDNTLPTYFGLNSGYLDIHTMKYRIFGAVWKLVDGRRYILGYWFADHENEIHCAIQKAGFSAPMISQKNEIDQIYQIIRTEQNKKNWSIRRRLHFLLIMKKPWKELTEGWYVLKSCNDFPMAVTCIQKKRYSIWIEHIKVCETEEDIKEFLSLVNLEHNINLIPGIIGSQFCKQFII